MPNCMEQVYSEEYYDFLIPYGVEAEVPSTPGCVQRIAEVTTFFSTRERDCRRFLSGIIPTRRYQNATHCSIRRRSMHRESPGCRISRCLR